MSKIHTTTLLYARKTQPMLIKFEILLIFLNRTETRNLWELRDLIISRDTLPRTTFSRKWEKTVFCSSDKTARSVFSSLGEFFNQGRTVQITDIIHNGHHCFHIKLNQAHDYLKGKYVQINWLPIISHTFYQAMLCF